MVEHSASRRYYQDTEQAIDGAANAGSDANHVRRVLALFNCSGAGPSAVHHFGKRTERGNDRSSIGVEAYGLVKVFFDGRLRVLRLGLVSRVADCSRRRSIAPSPSQTGPS